MARPEDTVASQQNNQHSFFTDLLEKVILTLRPRFAISAGNIGAAESPDNTLENVSNRFEALEVEELEIEELAQDQDTDTSAATATPAKVPASTYELVPSKSEEEQESEKLFVVFCLFDDLAQSCTFISKLWLDLRLRRWT
ncbi:hypothetical protein PVAG01_05337 [Phlyctema vagabunda]|uniref:DUF6604 domain-containing protein n=1 Tax=Phlyctema vagabunda TaxID=108571 RepID=A0ABR4PJV2_9HELO